MWRFATLLTGALAGCAASAPHLESHPWKPTAYQGFSESIDRLVGPDAIDCGMYDLLDRKVGGDTRRNGYRCVQIALQKRVPFKYGTHRLPIDSYATEVLARTPDGTLWFIAHDRMIDDETGETQQQWNQVCHSAEVNRKMVIIPGDGCAMRSEGQLKLP
jgi:hypothetical protein